MNMFKRFVAFAIAVVMICGMLPVSVSATENHSHDHSAHSDIQPFTGTNDLIAQVQGMLAQKGTFGAGEADQELIEAVEEMSGNAYNQAATTLAVGFFNDRVGSEGRIDTANLNLDEATMAALVEKTLKDYYLDGIVEVDYVVKYGVVTDVTFTMRDSFAAGLDQIETGISFMDTPEIDTGVQIILDGFTTQNAPQTMEKAFPFTDVPEWARTAVNYLYQKGIVNGVSATKFGSNQSVTRGQAVTMIYRAMGTPAVSGKNPFKDVKAGQYYTDAIIWAAANGVVTGTSATTFEPNANVTREQLVTIIYRLASEYLGRDVSEKASLSAFKDSARISSWAQEAVKWAVGSGLVNGYTDNTFRPKNVATRAEYAQVLYKFLIMHTHKGTLVAAKAAGCVEPGNKAYYTCDCGKFYSDAECTKEIEKDSWVIKATGHKLTAHAAVEPTDTEPGNTAYWSCDNNCGMYFADAAGKKQIAEGSWIIEARGHTLLGYAAVAPTCTEVGNTEYWACQTCPRFFADAEAKTEIAENSWLIAANGHNWGAWNAEGTSRTCQVCGEVQYCDHSEMASATTASFNWVETSDYIVNADGSYGLNPEVYFLDANGYPIMEYDAEGNPVGPVTVGAMPDGSAITSLTLYLKEDGTIDVMPTRIPDIYIDWNDVDGNGAMDENEIAAAAVHTRMAWNSPTATVICPVCGGALTYEATVEQHLVDQAYIEQQASNAAMGAMMADEAAMGTFMAVMEQRVPEIMGEIMPGMMEEKMPQYMAQGMTQEEAQAKIQEEAQAQAEAQAQQEAFGAVLQNHPNVYAALNQMVAQLQPEYHSVLYTASVAMSETNVFSDTMNATQIYLDRTWANMCNFNEVYAKYFGVASPYWTTKNEEEGPMSAFKYVLNMQEEPFIPNSIMDYYMGMLTQAFMSYVQSYSGMLDTMLADAMNTIAPLDDESFDTSTDRTIADLLLLHDWLAAYGEFDMQSLVDQQTGASAGSDPITMTAFGTLLHEHLGIDGAVCLGYAATYNLLVQKAAGMIDEKGAITGKDPVVDFVMIKYLTNVAESSVAAGDSGFGDGDAMFNAPHFMNAVKLDNDNWYYIDACYDDINTEVISQERVETDGNISHNSFLLAPSTWEDMYDGNFQLMDSLYDGKDWHRVPDGQGGYKMQDNHDNVYETEQAAKDAKDAAEENGEVLQIFYVYEPQEDPKEIRYEDAKYETSWFVSATGAVTYRDGYFYYTSGAVNSYSSMKDMFGDDEEGGDNGMEMDRDDMLEYKGAPSAQDKIVRRPVDAATNTDSGNDNGGMSMNTNNDEYCEILFHFGYGSTGARAQEQYEADINDDSMSMDSSIEESEKGPYYDLTQDDALYISNYPDICHSTVLIDGAIYFNMGNAIYTFNYTADEMAKNDISAISDLELVKVKEYNTVNYSKLAVNPENGANRFTGKTFYVDPNGQYSVTYHPIAALSVNNAFQVGQDANGVTVTEIPTLFVSIATNFTNSYKTEVTVNGETTEQPYLVEARNYNPDYYRFMEEEETEGDVNDNVEFMWTASIVDSMAIADFKSDLALTSGTEVSVDAYCAHNAFTEQRTAKCGLSIPGTKVEQEGTALNHKYAPDEAEGTNICPVCLEDHEHDYAYATAEDIDFVWTVVTNTTTAEDGSEVVTYSLTAEAVIYCGSDAFCGEVEAVQTTVTDNGDGSFTATATYGTITATETKTVDQVNHAVHNYGAPVFAWTSSEETMTDSNGATITVTVWSATATFTCKADAEDCLGSDAEGVREVTSECVVDASSGENIATVVGPDGNTYTDVLHVFSADDAYCTIVMDEGKDNFTATYKCTVCGYEHAITGTVVETIEAATCVTTGLITYTATAKADAVLTGTEGKTNLDLPEKTLVETTEIAVQGHTYAKTPVFTEDLTACEVTYNCSVCGDTYYVKANVEKTEVLPTCTEDGAINAVATVLDPENGAVVDTFNATPIVLPATGHAFGEATVTWTYISTADGAEGMTVSAYYGCTNGCGYQDVKEVSNPVKAEDGSWSAAYVHNGESITLIHTHPASGDCICGHHAHSFGADGNAQFCDCGAENPNYVAPTEPEETEPQA